jgi:protein-S-isoprenylcysteine O-methyltransferase Ste14
MMAPGGIGDWAADRWALPGVALLYVVLVLVVPVARLRLRAGRWPIDPSRLAHEQGLASAVLFFALAFYALWSVAFLLAGPSRLGVRGFSPTWTSIGWIGLLSGLAVVVIAQAQMGRAWRIGIHRESTELVTRGLFGLVRNPIYSGLILGGCGYFAVSPCVPTALAAIALALGFGLQARAEERHLLDVRGAEFRDYAERVGRFLPGVGRLRASPRP